MIEYKRLYLSCFGYSVGDFVSCEVCGGRAVDIHHIRARGMGGGEDGGIENLMAVCRKCHDEHGDRSGLRGMLYMVHRTFMDRYGVKYDKEKIEKYIAGSGG